MYDPKGKAVPLIINDFDSIDSVFNAFGVSDAQRTNIEILFASYTYEDYDGDAYVLCIDNGKLSEVYGSHCSCYGLEENGWESEEVTIEFIKQKYNKGSFGNIHKYGQQFVDIMANINELENTEDIIEIFRIHHL